MSLREWVDRVEYVSAGYGEFYGIERTPEWLLLKLTEEVGELSAAYLTLSGASRDRAAEAAAGRPVAGGAQAGSDDARAAFAAELADVTATALVIAARLGVDLDAALEDKWGRWERFHREREAAADDGAARPASGPGRPQGRFPAWSSPR